jgi:hypothetical protein
MLERDGDEPRVRPLEQLQEGEFMKISKAGARLGLGALVAGLTMASAGSAMAAFPNFSDCPRSTPGVTSCFDVQSASGSMTIKGLAVPLDHSLEIRGGLDVTSGAPVFVAPTGTNGFFATPVDVPGGLLGINLPIPGNKVTATAQLAGPASTIHVNTNTLELAMPLKLKLSNPLIGSGCSIGSNSDPANVDLIIGTTNPPPPNQPITGHVGTVGIDDGTLTITGTENVDDSFAVPGATGCGFLGLGLINALVDAKLQLPSAAGNNTLIIDNDVAIQAAN